MDVIILAGGLGTRLRSAVSDLPKCMAPVDGKPFLYYLLESLRPYRIDKVVLSLGYMSEKVIEWVNSCRQDYSFIIDWTIEEEPLGTGGGIRLAMSKCSGSVLILNGDTMFQVPVDTFAELHRVSGSDLSIALKPMREFSRYGAVDVQNDIITAFREKSYCQQGVINGGVYLMNAGSNLLEGHGDKFSFEKCVLEPMAAQSQLSGFAFNNYFLDIGIPEDYMRAQTEFPDSKPWQSNVSGSHEIPMELLDRCDTLFLDRDGVINRWLPGDYVKNWSEFEFLPGFLDEIGSWSRHFKHIFIVTNQRGVGKGLMSQASLDDIHNRMVQGIQAAGGRIDRIYVCTSLSNDDPLRKPGNGMALQAMKDFPGVSMKHSLMIGDQDSDAQFAHNSGMYFLKVSTA